MSDIDAPDMLEEPAPFIPPKMQDNPAGWGPVAAPEAFKKLPYQSFNKGDKIGKIVDWTSALYGYQDRRFGGRWAQNAAMYSSGPMGTQYTYVHDEDDSQFQLVDTSRTRSTYANRANRIKQQQYLKKLVQRDRDKKAQAGYAQASFYRPPGGGALSAAAAGLAMGAEGGATITRGVPKIDSPVLL